jgi:hypothetical protein
MQFGFNLTIAILYQQIDSFPLNITNFTFFSNWFKQLHWGILSTTRTKLEITWSSRDNSINTGTTNILLPITLANRVRHGSFRHHRWWIIVSPIPAHGTLRGFHNRISPILWRCCYSISGAKIKNIVVGVGWWRRWWRGIHALLPLIDRSATVER